MRMPFLIESVDLMSTMNRRNHLNGRLTFFLDQFICLLKLKNEGAAIGFKTSTALISICTTLL